MKNIDFSFYLDSDTAHTIAQEMVEQLELVYEDIAVIAELIDDLILKFVPTWKPSFRKSSSSEGMSSPEGSIIIQNGQIACGPSKVVEAEEYHGCKGSENSSFAYSSDGMKSPGVSSNDSYNKNLSNDLAFHEDSEKDVCEDLKQELDRIDAQYHQMYSELQKFREAAIEDAKRRWESKKKLPEFCVKAS